MSVLETHSSMLTHLSDKVDRCVPILPFPREHVLTFQAHEPKEIPSIFRFSHYSTKLKSSQCNAVYRRYNTLALSEAMASGRTITPRFLIAPMNTAITFFDQPMTPFSITNSEFDTIQSQAATLPNYFSWMDQPYILRPFNQGLCGSCWAVSSAMCLSDVFAVSTKTNPQLSPTYILSCLPQSQCDGGDPGQALHDMIKNGISTSECLNYDWCNKTGCSGDPLKHFDATDINKYIPPCHCSVASKPSTLYFPSEGMAICIPPKLSEFTGEDQTQLRYYLDSLYGNVDSTHLDLSHKPISSIRNLIKYYIHTYGPMVGGFHVFKNFFSGDYHETNGIYVESCSYGGIQGVDYSDLERDWVGSHAVVVVGWGKDMVHGEEVEYWVVRNSWGTSWGTEGTFKMSMYGNDLSKKYQNRASQFEYPSIVKTDQGIGITGGLLMMKAGNVKEPEQNTTVPHPTPNPSPAPESPPQSPGTSPTQLKVNNMNLLAFLVMIVFIVILYYVFRQDIESWKIIGETILLLFITGLILSSIQKN